jgi:DNA-directed RNA polymerase specialized sigma24 family protein
MIEQESDSIDPDEFLGELFVEVGKILVSHWTRLNRSFDVATDLAAEGVVQGVQKLHKYERRNGASLKTFLVRVGINKGKDILKRREFRFEKAIVAQSQVNESVNLRIRCGRRKSAIRPDDADRDD